MDDDLTRLCEKLRRDFGPEIVDALADPKTIEVMLNADEILWQERMVEKNEDEGDR